MLRDACPGCRVDVNAPLMSLVYLTTLSSCHRGIADVLSRFQCHSAIDAIVDVDVDVDVDVESVECFSCASPKVSSPLF